MVTDVATPGGGAKSGTTVGSGAVVTYFLSS